MSKPSAARLEKLYEQRRTPHTSNAATSPWTPERCAVLTEMWAAGASCRQIAIEIGGGISRSSVIGKAHRLKLPSRLTVHPKTNHRYGAKPKVKRAPKAKIKGFRPGVPLPVLPEALPGDMEALQGDAWAALPNTSPKPLLTVSDDRCRWPIGEDRPYLFCGEPTHKGVYCAAHYSVAYRPIPPKVSVRPVRKFSGMQLLEMEGL